jgi:hypothetical protein
VQDESRPPTDTSQSPKEPAGADAPASRGNGASGPRRDPSSRIRGKPFFSSVDASLLGIGSQMLSEVAAGVLLGYGLDYLLGTKNRWIVVGSIAGIVVAMMSVFRLALKTQPPRRQPPGTRSSGGAPREEPNGGDSPGTDR